MIQLIPPLAHSLTKPPSYRSYRRPTQQGRATNRNQRMSCTCVNAFLSNPPSRRAPQQALAHLCLLALGHLLQLATARQVRRARIRPDLVVCHLRILVKVEHVRELLVPRLALALALGPCEGRGALGGDALGLRVDNPATEGHVAVREVLLQERKVGGDRGGTGAACEGTAEEGGEGGQPVLEGGNLMGGREV